MNYATGCAFNLDELFYNFPTNKLKLTCEDCLRINNDAHKLPLIKKIFRESARLIINDVIENNVTFLLPTLGKNSDIHITKIDGDNFKRARLNGKFSDIDILASWFSGNQMTFNMYSNGRTRTKPIYLNKELKDRITEKTNQGFLYC